MRDSLDLAESRTRDHEVVPRRSRETTKWSDSKRSYLEIDASSGANSFEIGKLRLSAFQNGDFCRIPKASALKGDSLDLAESRTRDHEVVQPRSGYEIDL